MYLVNSEQFFVHCWILCWLKGATQLHLSTDDVDQLHVIGTVSTAEGTPRHNHVKVEIGGTDQ